MCFSVSFYVFFLDEGFFIWIVIVLVLEKEIYYKKLFLFRIFLMNYIVVLELILLDRYLNLLVRVGLLYNVVVFFIFSFLGLLNKWIVL